MYRVNNYSGTVYEKIFNYFAIESFVNFLASFSEESGMEYLVGCSGFFDEPKKMHNKLIKTMEEYKDDFIGFIPYKKIHPKYLSEEQTFDLYKQTLNFLYSDESLIPNPEIQYCIAKSLLNEFDYFKSVWKAKKIKKLSDLEVILKFILKEDNFTEKEIREALDFVNDKYNLIKEIKGDIPGISKESAKKIALEQIVEMFTASGMIKECFHSTDYELIDENPEYAKNNFHRSLDDLLMNYSNINKKSKTIKQEENIL